MISLIWIVLFISAAYFIGSCIITHVPLRDKSFDKLRTDPGEEHGFVISQGIGWGVLSLVMFGLGTLGIISRPVYMALIIGPGILGLAKLIRQIKIPAIPKPDVISSNKILSVFAAIVLISVISYVLACYLPVTEPDSLTYHLPIQKHFVNKGRIYNISHTFNYSTFPQLGETLYIPAMVLAPGASGETLVNFIHTWFGLLTALAIYMITKQNAGIKAGIWGAGVFLLIPAAKDIMGSPQGDLTLAFYFLLTGLTFFNWIKTKHAGWICLAGLFSGFSFGVKYTGVLAVLWLAYSFTYNSFFSHTNGNTATSGQSQKKAFLIYALIFALAACPWLIRNFVYTQNPFTPFFNGIFQSTSMNEYLVDVFNNHKRAIVLPLFGYLLDFIGENGDIFLLFALCLPFIKLPEGAGFFVVFGAIYTLIAMLWLPSIVRFMLPGLALISIGVGCVFDRLIDTTRKPRRTEKGDRENKERGQGKYGDRQLFLRKSSLSPFFIFPVPIFSLSPFSVLRGFLVVLILGSVSYKGLRAVHKISEAQKWKTITGIESRGEYLKKHHSNYEMAQYMNQNINPDATILSLNEGQIYYFNNRIIVSFNTKIGSVVHTSKDVNYILDYLKENNINYLLINNSQYCKHHQRETILLENDILNRYFKLVKSIGTLELYRVK